MKDAEAPPSILLVAGEASGDRHTAALASALLRARPDLRLWGAGGPEMRAAGVNVVHDLASLGVVGLSEVLAHYGAIRAIFRDLLRRIRDRPPALIVLTDYPGFNLRLAKKAHPRGCRIVYHISPQVWAWHETRKFEIASRVERMLVIFPFEVDVYGGTGLDVRFIGHPLVDRVAAWRNDAGSRVAESDRDLLLLLPGSRESEVRRILPAMLDAAAIVAADRPDTRFAVVCPTDSIRSLADGSMSQAVGGGALRGRVSITVGPTFPSLARARAAVVASGTATMECAFFGLPMAIVYRVSPVTFAVARRLVKVSHVGMVNLLADRPVAREFIQEGARPEDIAAEALRLMDDEDARTTAQAGMARVVDSLGPPGCAERGAEAILELLA